MSTLILAIFLVGGFLFVELSPPTRYKFKRSDGWGAYFMVAKWGIIFAILSGIVTFFLNRFSIFRWSANYFGISPESFSGILPIEPSQSHGFHETKQILWLLITVILATTCGLFSMAKNRGLTAIAKIIESPFESLIIESIAKQQPISITLSSKKFYVGIVLTPNLANGPCGHISIIPLLSGYRDKDTLSVNIVTNYYEHYKKQKMTEEYIENFVIVMPTQDIQTISFFDIQAYSAFKETEHQSLEQK